MTRVESILAIAGAIILIFTISTTILYLLRKFIQPRAITLCSKGFLFVQNGKKTIFFSDSKAANAFITQCNQAEVFWEVYALSEGKVKLLGNSKDLILGAI